MLSAVAAEAFGGSARASGTERLFYIDLDGDSELDVMVKRAPGRNDRAHILLDDKWTPVKEFDKQWIFVNQARSPD